MNIYRYQKINCIGRSSITWTKTFEGIKKPHRKQACSDCDNGKNCSDCITKPKMNCFNCEMGRACKSCLDLISQRKTFSTDIKMLKRNIQTNIINCFLNMKETMSVGKIILTFNLPVRF